MNDDVAEITKTLNHIVLKLGIEDLLETHGELEPAEPAKSQVVRKPS